MRIELICLVGLVDNGEGNSEPQPLEVPHLLGQGDGLRGKVHLQFEYGGMPCPLTGDVEDPALHHLLTGLHLQHEEQNNCTLKRIKKLNFILCHLLLPVLKELLSVELLPEGLAILFQLLPLHVDLPPFTQDILNTTKVSLQLTINLDRERVG